MDGGPEPDADSGPAPRRPGFFVHVVPALLYVLAVFYGGSVGVATVTAVPFLSFDKLLHGVAFAGMQLVVFRAVRFQLPRLELARHNLLTLCLVSAIGALLEFYQLALPHRSAELLDWVADTLGAALGAAFLQLVARRRRRRRPRAEP
jgi:hypothetical protein